MGSQYPTPRPELMPTPSSQDPPLSTGKTDHPLSPHAMPNGRRSPSIFAVPLVDNAGPSVDLDEDPSSSNLAIFAAGGRDGRAGITDLESRSSLERSAPVRGSKSRASLALDSLGREEIEVVRQRYDLISDAEIRRILEEWDREGSSAQPVAANDGEAKPRTFGEPSDLPLQPTPSRRPLDPDHDSSGRKSPLFPPSPPSLEPVLPEGLGLTTRRADHPLRILARAVLELQETVERLQAENAALRADISGSRHRTPGAGAINIHDDLNEAISTSLTTAAPVFSVPSFQSGRFPDPPRVPSPVPSFSSNRPISVRSHHRDNASIRSVDVRSTHIARTSASGVSLPSNRSVRSVDMDDSTLSPGKAAPMRKRDAARSSWTSSLWGWGGASGSKKRQGSISSLRGQSKGDEVAVMLGEEEEDEHAWRKGDGGSSPSFRAVFLATRLVTPDPLSILSSSQIAPNSLIAYLSHSLVSHARDQGVVARDPPNTRRRLSRESRSRAGSIVSQESHSTSTGDGRREKTYGETLAATALYGRSFLSGTIRAGNRSLQSAEGGDTVRPSLLNRPSARTFPTTALSPSTVGEHSAASTEDDTPLPSVEMASMAIGENQPPTVLLSRQNLGLYFQSGSGKGRTVETASRFKGVDPPLTDRYGFIYDIQHASMLKDASAAGVPAPASLNGIIPGVPKAEEDEGWIERRRRESQELRPELGSRRSTGSIPSPTPALGSTELSASSASSGVATPSRTPSSARLHLPASPSESRHRSSTLMLNPSPARPVTAKDTLTVSARGASSLRSAATRTSPLPDSAHATTSTPTSAAVSRATISSLLDQLTELHDRQQAERKTEWDAWLAKRKRKRAGSTSTKAKGETGWGGDMIGISQMGLGDAEEWRAFAKLVRHGIPLAYRSDVWAGAKDAVVPGEYREILAVHAPDPSPVLAEIEKDVSRTFPGNMFFGGDGPGVAKLRRVLVAYSWRNPRVGYCQGMNMLAATLLLTHADEEQAFWALSAMIDRLLPTDFYSPSLLASRADQLVLADLVEVHLPRISATLSELGVDLASITFGWFLSLFTDCLPVETLFRVWDVFFVEGHDTLFRVALAMLKLNEAEICAAESAGDLFTFVAGMTSRLWAADKLISTQHGYRPIVRHADIAGRYSKHLAELQEP